MRLTVFVLGLYLFIHSFRDFLQWRGSDVWLAKKGHNKAKYYFDRFADKMNLGWIKDKELLHSGITFFFGVIFLYISIFIL